MDEVKKIVNDIKAGNIKPIYFLMGEEPYYVDKIAEYMERSILTEEERGFNQMVIYGKDATVDEIVSSAKRYPMMAERQVIIVKEAQHLSRTIDQLEAYALNPQPTTVLVICYKYKKLDKRKKVYKAISKTGYIFESKKLYENQIGDWIRKVLAGRKYSITPKAAQMLVEFLGTDLGKINNELEKLQLIIPKGEEITPKHIEENIGISKDYNNFELRKAIGERDIVKATRIVTYFAQNPKDNPMVMTISLLYSFFSQLLQYHGLKDHSKGSVASALKVNPYFVGEYQTAARNYPMKQCSKIVTQLRAIDVKSKGVGAVNISQADLLKELLFSIFNSPSRV
ncbi:DNA polymerase III subunit delta [Galbibacter pacificus]|uniref:DNA polymerase III subunit delta n=1 Tax=Galbibacter pacificus TaxID=2996052 RepID=A0ABT6FQA2_9FLAO|nr:DNA polymerase III subunit delta [Galbibacter pacificus]MDG3582248.1 DNA polymerase III subunit delta [Galbibacter pacificus]MDG3585276.1 DNA polymerase III subunit delta [Galbibacter pacificus]